MTFTNKLSLSWPGVMATAFNPSTLDFESEASLVFRISSRSARTIQKDSALHSLKKRPKIRKWQIFSQFSLNSVFKISGGKT